MRGRATGLGSSICSIGLLIVAVVGDGFVKQVACDFHGAYDSLNERDFLRRETVLSIKVSVGPFSCPLLGRYECIDFPSNVLGWLVQKDQKTGQPTAEI